MPPVGWNVSALSKKCFWLARFRPIWLDFRFWAGREEHGVLRGIAHQETDLRSLGRYARLAGMLYDPVQLRLAWQHERKVAQAE